MNKVTDIQYIPKGPDQDPETAAQEDLIEIFFKNIEVSKDELREANIDTIKSAISAPLLMLASTSSCFKRLVGEINNDTLIKAAAKHGVIIKGGQSNIVPASFSPAVIQWAHEELAAIEHIQQIQDSVNHMFSPKKK